VSAGRVHDGRILADPLQRRGPAPLDRRCAAGGGGVFLIPAASNRGRRGAPGLHGAHEVPQVLLGVPAAADAEDPRRRRPAHAGPPGARRREQPVEAPEPADVEVAGAAQRAHGRARLAAAVFAHAHARTAAEKDLYGTMDGLTAGGPGLRIVDGRGL